MYELKLVPFKAKTFSAGSEALTYVKSERRSKGNDGFGPGRRCEVGGARKDRQRQGRA
jgi:hypothetical protein